MIRFKDKEVLIVGGGAGIGKAIVELFLGEGASVIFTDISEEGFMQEKNYKEQGFTVSYIQANATDENDFLFGRNH